MSNGKNALKIDTQIWASFAFFLKYYWYSNFSHIELEPVDGKDFTLYFTDGKKIICEVKDWKKRITLNEVLNIIKDIEKKRILGSSDEIYIIANEFDKDTAKVGEDKIWLEISGPEKLNLTKEKFETLKKLYIWRIGKKDEPPYINFVISLLYEIFNFWIPYDYITKVAASLKDYIFETRAKSKKNYIISKREIDEHIENEKLTIKNEYSSIEKKYKNDFIRIKQLIKIIRNNKPEEFNQLDISALSQKISEYFVILRELKNKENLDLKKWGNFFQPIILSFYQRDIFTVFEKNINTLDNIKFVLGHIKNNLELFEKYHHITFWVSNVKDVLTKILNSKYYKDELNETIFKLIENLFKNLDPHSYMKFEKEKNNQDKEFRYEELTELLHVFYVKTTNYFKKEIYKYILTSFNLVADDGKYWHYTPNQIFYIIREYITSDWNNFERNFDELVKVLINQLELFYGRFGSKIKYEGWDHIGSGIWQVGDSFGIEDKHFITYVLAPALRKYYLDNPDRNWRFILKNCIFDENEISKEKPDFLNRASLSVIFEAYISQDKQKSEEAFGILKNFIKTRRGIPWKNDLIFQRLQDSNIPNDKKWRLVKVVIDEYKLPANVFVEKIIQKFIEVKEYQKETLAIIKKWFSNEKYLKDRLTSGGQKHTTLWYLLENKETFDEGVKIFNNFIISEYFKNLDISETWDIAKRLTQILEKNFEIGLNLVNKLIYQNIIKKNKLKENFINNKNLQYLILNAIESLENKEIIKKIYLQVIKPLLFNVLKKDNKKIEKVFKEANTRTYFVKFTEKLIDNNLTNDAFEVIKIFVQDSNPQADDEYHQEILKSDKDIHAIETVRGWVCWDLQKLIFADGGRFIHKNINKVFKLVEKLIFDEPNYYVKYMAMFSLKSLAHIRNMVFEKNSNKYILKREHAQKIEKLVFETIESDFVQKNKCLLKQMVYVFDNIRALKTNDAKRFINAVFENKLSNDSQEGKVSPKEQIIIDVFPLLIFFAEFRDKAYQEEKFKNKRWEFLKDFNPSYFQDLIYEILKNNKYSSELKHELVKEFWRLYRKGWEDEKKDYFNISYKYLDFFIKNIESTQKTYVWFFEFIDESLERHLEEAFELFIKTLKKIKFLIKKGKLVDDISYRDDYIVGQIFQKLFNLDKKKFLKGLQEVLDFPKDKVPIGKNTIDLFYKLEDSLRKNKSGKKIDGLIKEKLPYDYFDKS